LFLNTLKKFSITGLKNNLGGRTKASTGFFRDINNTQKMGKIKQNAIK
jgi:hypothetical protein